MQIGELAKKVGINASAIRYYESIGLLPKVERSSGQRFYSESIVVQLKVIQAAKRMGFSIKELQLLMKGFSPTQRNSKAWRTLAETKVTELTRVITEAREMQSLIQQAMDCGCVDLKECQFIK